MGKTLRTAVVGLGRIGWQYHLPTLQAHEGFEVVGVVDPLDERRAEAHDTFGVAGYVEFDDMLAAAGAELVVLASPTHLHADQAVAAMRQGLDVFCDKPMAPTLAEADRMIAVAEETGRKLMVYQPKRGTSEVLILQDVLARGLIGPLFMIKRRCGAYARRHDWQAFKKYGGGMLNNYGAHYLDETLYLAQQPARRVTAHLKAIATLGDAEDVVKVLIETEGGITLDVEINIATAVTPAPWCLCGAHGTIVFDGEAQAFRVRYFDPEALGVGSASDGLAADGRQYGSGEDIPWQEEVLPLAGCEPLNFYDKVYGYMAMDEPPFVPLSETREVMRILDVCRKDAGWDG